MDFPMHVDTISIELPILYIKVVAESPAYVQKCFIF